MSTKTRSNDKALATFMSRKAEIDTMLTRLQALSDDHFNANPDDITLFCPRLLRACPICSPLVGACHAFRCLAEKCLATPDGVDSPS